MGKLSSFDSDLVANASRQPIQANFRCTKCTGDIPVNSKRKIEPLSKIASQIEQRLQSWQQIMQNKIDSQKAKPTRPTLDLGPKHQVLAQSINPSPPLSSAETIASLPGQIHPENLPEVAVQHLSPTDPLSLPEVTFPHLSPTSPRSFSNMSIHSGHNSNRFSPTQKQHGWQSLFKSNRSSSTSFSIPSYTFFACGNRLLLWNERGSGFYDLLDADSIIFRRINSSNVHIAAGGTNTCAIVAKAEQVSFWHSKNHDKLKMSRTMHCRCSTRALTSPSGSGELRILHSQWPSRVTTDTLH